MDIAYSLVDNKLTSGPNDLRTRVQISNTANIDDLSNDLVRPTVARAEIMAMYEDFKTSTMHPVQNGRVG